MAPPRSLRGPPSLGSEPTAAALRLLFTATLLFAGAMQPVQGTDALGDIEVQSVGRTLAQDTQKITIPGTVADVPPYIPFTAPPNCAQAPNIVRGSTNVYRAFTNKMANVRAYNEDGTIKDTSDDLHYFMVDVCNYIASKAVQKNNVSICCRAVDLYGDLWATQTVWGIVAQGNDFTSLKWNRGVNFSDPSQNPLQREAILTSQGPTVYTAAQSLVCSNKDVPQNITCSFDSTDTSGSDASLTTTTTAGIDMSYVMKFGSKGIFGGVEFALQLDFGYNWSDSSTTTISKSTATKSSLVLKVPPGQCYGTTATVSSTTATFQVRQKAALQGPMYMYFSPYTTYPRPDWNRVVNGYFQDGSQPKGGADLVSALRLLNDPQFDFPTPTGSGNFINTPQTPGGFKVGNYNAQNVKNNKFGPYLNGWGPNDNPATWLGNRRDIIGSDDFLILRGDAAYIATPGDFVKYAVSIGYPIDDYHKSMVDNVWTKVDTVTVTYNNYDSPIQPLDIDSELCKGIDAPPNIG